MLPPFAIPGEPGTAYPIMIDGIPISLLPPELPMPSDPVELRHEMGDGRRRSWVRRPGFSGIDLGSERFTIALDLKSLSRPQDIINLEEIRADAGNHLVTVWRPSCVKYELLAGVTRLWIPHARKCAPHFYDGIEFSADGRNLKVNTEQFATEIERDGDPLTVTYAAGPALTAPASGGIVIAKNAATEPPYTDYVPMLLGDVPNGGEKLKMWTFLTYVCRMRSDVRLQGGISESHGYVFEEE